MSNISTFKRRLLCYSLIGRKVFFLEGYRLSEEKKKSGSIKGKKIVVLLARGRPGESVTNWVLKGAVDKLLDLEALTELMEYEKESPPKSPSALKRPKVALAPTPNKMMVFLRDNYHFIILPMMDPDAVMVGNSRTALSGQDVTSVWDNPDRFIHPETFYIKKILSKLKQENQIVLFCELKSTIEKSGHFITGGSPPINNRVTKEFAQLLNYNLNGFSAKDCE